MAAGSGCGAQEGRGGGEAPRALTLIHAGAVEHLGLLDGRPVLRGGILQHPCGRGRAGRRSRGHGHPRALGAAWGSLPLPGAPATFEDDFQLVPENVEHTVAGAGLGDDVAPQPAATRVLVEVFAGLLRLVHVLQDPGRCSRGGVGGDPRSG